MNETRDDVPRKDILHLYTGLLLSVAAFQLLWRVLTACFGTLPEEWSSRFGEIVLLIPSIGFSRQTSLTAPLWGLRVPKEKRKAVAMQCALLAAGIVGVFVLARLVLARFSPEVAARPFFRPYLDVKMRAFYLLFAIVQETLSKGVLQNALEKSLPEKRWPLAIAVMSAVFVMMHIGHTLYYVLGAILVGVVTGILYHRDGHAWRCIVFHFLIGFLPRCFGLK